MKTLNQLRDEIHANAIENNKSKSKLIAVEFEDDNGVTNRIEHDDDTSLEC